MLHIPGDTAALCRVSHQEGEALKKLVAWKRGNGHVCKVPASMPHLECLLQIAYLGEPNG